MITKKQKIKKTPQEKNNRNWVKKQAGFGDRKLFEELYMSAKNNGEIEKESIPYESMK